MRYQGLSRRKYTGKRLRELRGKRKFHIANDAMETHTGEHRSKPVRGRGGNWRNRLLQAQFANVTNPSTGKTRKAEIKTVEGNTANIHFVRRNVISKGALIQTSVGTAKVTSRPGQHGVINAVLIKSKKSEKTTEPEIEEQAETVDAGES